MLDPKICFQKTKHGFYYATRIKTDPLSEYLIIESIVHLYGKIAGFPPYIKQKDNGLCMYLDGDVYLSVDDWMVFYQAFKKDFSRFSKHIVQLHKYYYSLLLQKTKNLCERKNFGSYSNGELNAALKEFFVAFTRSSAIAVVPFSADHALKRLLQEELAKQGIREGEADKIIYSIARPDKISLTTQENIDLKNLARLIEGGKNITPSLLKHQKKYAWLGFSWLYGKPLELEYFEKRIKEMLERQNRPSHKTQEKFDFVPTQNIKKFAAVLKEMSYRRTWRLEMANQAVWVAHPLFLEAAKRLDLTYKELLHLVPLEVEQALGGKFKDYRRLIHEREKGFGTVFDSGFKIITITNAVLREFQTYFERAVIGAYKDATTIYGTPVYPGLVKGIAAIINGPDQFHKFKKGNILVTPMTTPDYMPILEYAAAIITDIGGVTAHAAIIARELGIPCIVGTKIATRSLKDGERVEVDAKKGMVTKIKNKSAKIKMINQNL